MYQISSGKSKGWFTSKHQIHVHQEYLIEYWEIILYCSDGCSKSGLFVALRLVLEKMQMDDEVDMFQVVRAIQIRRPEFLPEFVSVFFFI